MEKVIPIKEEKPLISVIVPVYNGQDYLENCITSIEHQTYDNLEVIPFDKMQQFFKENEVG